MIYLLDTHTLSKALLASSLGRTDIYVMQEVVDEWAYSPAEISRINSAGIRIIDVSAKHLRKLMEVLSKHADNLKLIRLFTGEGTADVVMIAYILSERDERDTLFTEECTIITKDKELTSVAKSYGIKCKTNL